MAYLLGEDINIGFGREATRGTYQTPNVWVPGRTPGTMNVALDKAIIRETTGSGMSSSGSIAVQQRAEGKLDFNLRSSSIGYLLLSLLGKVTTTTVTTGVYQHVFQPLVGNPQFPTLSVAVSRPGQQDYKYLKNLISSLEIKFPIDDLVNASAQLIGGTESTNTSYTPSFASTDYYFRPFDVTIKVASDVSGLAGASPFLIKDLSWKGTNGAKANQNISELVPGDFLAAVSEYTGSFKIDLDGETFHNDFKNAAYKAMQITLSRADIDLGSSHPPSLTIIMPKVTYEKADPDLSLDDIAHLDVDFYAHFDSVAGYGIQATLINAYAAYTT